MGKEKTMKGGDKKNQMVHMTLMGKSLLTILKKTESQNMRRLESEKQLTLGVY